MLAPALLVVLTTAAGDPPFPGVTGTVKAHEKFPSALVAPRTVTVWLPPSYDGKPAARYPVLYMHDGQNLFDPKTSFIGIDWGVDEAMTALIATGKVREAIVVGVWNTPRRVQEYLPAKMILSRPTAEERSAAFRDLAKVGVRLDEKTLLADDYLKFLVTELKPFIDQTYRTSPGRGDTLIMGSSAGALISLYAVTEYPEVFGGAGCVSTHWPVLDGLMIEYAKGRLPDPATHKLYFDFGTETLDKGYESYQKKMDAAVTARGYVEGRNWLTRKFAGADHSERSWRARVHVPLEFLLGR